MLSPKERVQYGELVCELRAMSTRLGYLADAGYDDMEGADQPEFSLSEELWGLKGTADRLAVTATRMETLLK